MPAGWLQTPNIVENRYFMRYNLRIFTRKIAIFPGWNNILNYKKKSVSENLASYIENLDILDYTLSILISFNPGGGVRDISLGGEVRPGPSYSDPV